jgi:hypothetical protein
MSQDQTKGTWKSIKFDRFQEDPLPSGRVLLHCFFRDNWGNSYKWTPPWKEVEKIFLKAIEIEEGNEPEGVWDEELKKVSQKLPSLKAFRLPVKIGCLRLEDLGEENYRMTIEILGEEKTVEREGDNFSVGACVINLSHLLKRVLDLERLGGRRYGIGINPYTLRSVFTDWPDPVEIGVCFDIWLKKGMETTEYVTAAREILGVIRSYIREVLSDFGAIKEGFEREE